MTLQPFIEREQLTGLRASWSTLVSDKVERQKLAVPLGVLFSPFKTLPPDHISSEIPVICKCGAALSLANTMLQSDSSFSCRFCNDIQRFPQRMEGLTQETIPPELKFQGCEFLLRSKAVNNTSIILAVDTSVEKGEFDALRNLLQQNLSLFPTDFRVGLITIGQANNLYDLSSPDIIHSYSFHSSKDYTNKEFADMLDLPLSPDVTTPSLDQRFLVPVETALLSLDAIFTDLTQDPFRPPDLTRHSVGTGSALSLAITLHELLSPQCPGRIMLFLGKPCTVGNGAVIGLEFSEKMRQHYNLQKDVDLKYFAKAKKFYDSQAQRAVQCGTAVDVFMGCKDQIGFAEMRSLVDLTGGYSVLSDSFSSSQFKLSFQKLFDRGDCTADDLDMAFNAKIVIKCSEHLKITGALGPCAPLGIKNETVNNIEIGKGGTYQWKLNALDSLTTLAFFFEVVPPDGEANQNHREPVIQFQTLYTRASGFHVLRVVTVDFRWSNPAHNFKDVIMGFDHEAAACLVARYAMNKAEQDSAYDIVRWIDRTLIKVSQRFASFSVGDPNSFVLPPQFSIFPQSLFYLRRSRVLRLFNHTPDESAFYRAILCRENVGNMMTIIVPSLYAFELNKDPQPVLLDVSSLTKERILILDTFFRLIVLHGETIAIWRESKLQESPQYPHFKKLLEQPIQEAEGILSERFPSPQVLVCDQNSSQARFVVSQLNPSISLASSTEGNSGVNANTEENQREGRAMMFSDDVTLKSFLEKLKTIVTQKQ